MNKPKRRRNVPPSTGKFFALENELIEKINDVCSQLGVSSTQVINDCIRHGLESTINKIKYGK